MNNPLRILQTLDRHLSRASEITLFGRAALALGYENSPPEFAGSQDVDAILPLPWLAAEDDNMDFWQAQVKTNAELQPEGLYITHLFRELEVILTPGWLPQRVRLRLPMHRLAVFRPSTLDLILTKMMRGDENDRADIRFLLIARTAERRATCGSLCTRSGTGCAGNSRIVSGCAAESLGYCSLTRSLAMKPASAQIILDAIKMR